MAQQPLPPPSPDLVRGVTILRQDAARTHAIELFAAAAKTGDVDALLAIYVPEARTSAGDVELRTLAARDIVPFFADYQKLDTYKTIEPGTMPDGRTGYRYYTYFVNSQSQKVPFDITLMDVNGTYLVANFNARGCVKGKHPVCS